MSEDNAGKDTSNSPESEVSISASLQGAAKEEKYSEKDSDLEISKRKVDILLKATGDAPIMKNKKWSVPCDRTIGSIIAFVKRYLKLQESDSLYIYVNQCFAPSPDQIIMNLYECFGADGKLVLHYCKTPAWG
ncbi:Ubiquitin-like protein ATG12 [Armadillidium nasatum]|uniref:Ubiquitin-like protein ATG12 n=1 Tax=Armadillidium nasatum TaxID=96803 RepID=A0A5N5SXK9_9CRUS|nr:Ubiquitin-like protein ATG12 [Armadillidium nasatum]